MKKNDLNDLIRYNEIGCFQTGGLSREILSREIF